MSFGSFVKGNTRREISTEVIDYQGDDPIVSKLINRIRELKDVYADNVGLDPKRLNEKVQVVLNKLDKDFKERFGINFRFIDMDNMSTGERGNPCTIPPFVPALSSASNYREGLHPKKYKDYVKEIKDLKNIGPVAKFIYKRIFGFYTDYIEKAIEYINEDGFYDVYQTLMTSGIKVDLKNARIENFPDTAVAPVVIPIGQMMHGTTGFIGFNASDSKKYKDSEMIEVYTDRQIAAIMLHEAGHVFTMIELMAQSYSNNIVFEDVLQDQIKRKEDGGHAFIMAYEKAYKDNTIRKELKDKDTADIILTVTKRKMERYSYAGREMRMMGEAAADQFSSRFGLGAELATSLGGVFMEISTYRQVRKALYSDIKITLLDLIKLQTIIQLAIMSLGGGIGLGIYLLFLFRGIILDAYRNMVNLFVGSLFKKLTKTGAYPYPDDFNRIEKIRADLVRILRTTKLTSEEKATIIKRFDKVQQIIYLLEKMNVDDDSFFKSSPILDFFSKTSSDLTTYGSFDRDLEMIMENPLYIEEARLRLKEEE